MLHLASVAKVGKDSEKKANFTISFNANNLYIISSNNSMRERHMTSTSFNKILVQFSNVELFISGTVLNFQD